MSRYRFSISTALFLSIILWALAPSAHAHGGGHGGGGHGGGGHGFGYGGGHGFGYGGIHGFGYGYGFRGFGFGGFGYPGFGFGGFSGFGLGGFSGFGFGGLGYGGFGYGGLGFGGLGFSGFGAGGYGYGGFYPSCNCCYMSAYSQYGGGILPSSGGFAPANGESTSLPMPNSVNSRTRYVDYYARNARSAPTVVVSTTAARYMDYYTRDRGPAAENKARLHVTLPADAELWLNGKQMQRKGADRDFITPQLKPGQTYSYQVKAQWMQEGRTREEAVDVKVRANETTNVQIAASSLAQR
jgi:uncharacterized protein (TIGR03000 family)